VQRAAALSDRRDLLEALLLCEEPEGDLAPRLVVLEEVRHRRGVIPGRSLTALGLHLGGRLLRSRRDEPRLGTEPSQDRLQRDPRARSDGLQGDLLERHLQEERPRGREDALPSLLDRHGPGRHPVCPRGFHVSACYIK